MAKTGKRKKWVVGLLTLLVLGAATLVMMVLNRPLLQRAALLKESEKAASDDKAWLPDHIRWLEVGEIRNGEYDGPTRSGIFLHSLDRPEFSKGKLVFDTTEMRSVQGITPDYRLIASDWPGGDGKQITLYEMGISSNTMPKRQVKFHAPPETNLVEMTLSPQGDRMAWLFSYDRSYPFASLLARFLPALKKKTHGVGLWVSRTDGRDLHVIGYQPSEEKQGVLYNVQAIGWMPDGKRIRFTYKNVLYTVPAD
jgi:hypothetical protein